MDKIELNGMEFYGYHGCCPEEREKGQFFFVDVSLQLSLKKAGKSDALEDTVNYASVFEDVRSIVEGSPHNLMESVAEAIANRLLMNYPMAESVCISMRKPNAPIHGKFRYASVTIERER
ncbi:MAG: dihydroneopterin aldolase [Selenomonadaceae bacterium]|nr:dihydroneopterin aldolase [Selenomonadaceae bacterium]MBR4695633.1 dihydroneopterin aldolase [Selenomonadaceae bacterium]